jgi:hypothetical protein
VLVGGIKNQHWLSQPYNTSNSNKSWIGLLHYFGKH